MTTNKLTVNEIRKKIGCELGVSDWIQIDQKQIDQFAECTKDHQWIHVDREAAAKGPFGKTIAHGFLTVSLLSYFFAETGIEPAGAAMAVNYGMNKIRMINPVPVDSRIRDRVVLTEMQEKSEGRILITTTHTVEIEGQEKPACVAEMLSMFFMNQ